MGRDRELQDLREMLRCLAPAEPARPRRHRALPAAGSYVVALVEHPRWFLGRDTEALDPAVISTMETWDV
jgi:hypothetical protein